jgi:hypothetical protein
LSEFGIHLGCHFIMMREYKFGELQLVRVWIVCSENDCLSWCWFGCLSWMIPIRRWILWSLWGKRYLQ